MHFTKRRFKVGAPVFLGLLLNVGCGRADASGSGSAAADGMYRDVSMTAVGEAEQNRFLSERVEETTLSSCFIDPRFNPDLVTYSINKCSDYYCWWNAHYKHGYLQRKTILLTTFDRYGQVHRQDTITRDSPLTVTLKSLQTYLSQNQHDAYGPSNPAKAIDEMRRHHGSEVAGRMLMQCSGQ